MTSLTRRRLLAAAAALPVVPAFAQTRPLTCGALTSAQTEGPFFKTNTPLRASLVEPQSEAPRLIVTGQVLSARCQPVANASEARSGVFRSEEHTSELQSHSDLVCRLLLEKKKKKK